MPRWRMRLALVAAVLVGVMAAAAMIAVWCLSVVVGGLAG